VEKSGRSVSEQAPKVSWKNSGEEDSSKSLNQMGQKKNSMDELEERARAQMMMIEQIYALKITNRDEVAKLIASKVDNDRQVLTICTSLNSWVLLNKKKGNVDIPQEVLSRLFEAIEWQKRHA
jgi:hypothetical protein